MFRVGLVKQQDLKGAGVRVAFPDRDQMLSYWLPILFSKTQNDKSYWIPDIGEQVVCLMDEHDEAGTGLGAIILKRRHPAGPERGQIPHVIQGRSERRVRPRSARARREPAQRRDD